MSKPARRIPIGKTRSVELRVKRAGWTLLRFLRAADTDAALWWKWANGKIAPRPKSWERILDALDRIEGQTVAA